MNQKLEHIWAVLTTVVDPEIPVLTVADLGIIRAVNLLENDAVEVVITPTYSGCPAMNAIEINIRAAMQEADYQRVTIKTILSPAWTTDWLTEAGREKLLAYGIAPPVGNSSNKRALFDRETNVGCPQCRSENTEMVAQFGSTSCKALWRCRDCKEPFDYFKCH
jgi:ring-1,2-phenylacetyl-CoA epoxidase subunit PaaD